MIRKATPADLPQLVTMIQALAAHHGDAATVSEVTLARDLFGQPPWMQMLVAQTDTTLTAYLALTQLTRLQWGQRGMDIHHLYVAESHRGTGLGSKMIAAAIETARAADCEYLTVTALETNAEAQAFYMKCGFSAAPARGHRFARDLSKG